MPKFVPLLVDGSTDGKLKATFGVRLKGHKLKVGGENCGIFFVPLLADGSVNADESAWIKVPEEFITRNMNVNLEFYLPRDIETGKSYCLAVRTSVRGNMESMQSRKSYKIY